MRATQLGRVLLGGGLACVGVLSLLSGDFALNWQPVPAWVPWREPLAYASGLLLAASGIGTLWRRTASVSTLVLIVNMLVWLVLLRAPRVARDPLNAAMWLGFGETLVLVTGAWTLRASLIGRDSGVRLAQGLFAAALPAIGLSHFVYAPATAALVPSWLPDRVALTYVTGGAHMAAGIAVLIGVFPRLAAMLEAIMISAFTVLVWGPRVAAAPAMRFPWTALFISAALAGAAFAVAGSLRRRSGRA